ncbi:cytochrome P450 4C1-like [Vespula pensylvanica]|uniref:cytochrome P450 4C1-like n=1 Tax=Vespula pensylvanica TaxID=30213 RepID=UPI001CBA3EBB|nr:cytochrome P450 4C1-like [Vespula pensylvanica]
MGYALSPGIRLDILPTLPYLTKQCNMNKSVKKLKKIVKNIISVEETQFLKNDLIPAGSICNISIHNLHRTPEFCSNLDVFNPGKSLRTENIKERNLYSYIPFSAEPKNYIGQKFALLRLKIIVAYILHNFYLNLWMNWMTLKL